MPLFGKKVLKNYDHSFYLNEVEKEQMKPKAIKRQEVIMIRVNVNTKTENRKLEKN